MLLQHPENRLEYSQYMIRVYGGHYQQSTGAGRDC
ncbi:hypothetical protein RUMOBE_01443 [Blautia obeum ATCC 29174]|uniref:Uncharacterized protein n=1 Tax=Blautia obeum ATCC 29174 TaxID=411459 RepID=A5ZR17_9FIRM|nr:hypothetical protein RUMOBE_01443 [Blautia obeum ATCC 29174]